jgi:hypothetical protein
MTPGVSEWPDHEPFLRSFAKITTGRRDNPGAIYYVVRANLPNGDTTFMDEGVISVVDGLIESIDTGGSSDVPQLRLPDFLLANGKPDEVWISTFSSVPEGKPPFRLFLVYRNGITAMFEQANIPTIDDQLTGCFQAPYNVFLLLVVPERPFTFAQAIESVRFTEEHRYLPLEEATGLSIDAFYKAFSNTNNTLCLQTPSELWDY